MSNNNNKGKRPFHKGQSRQSYKNSKNSFDRRDSNLTDIRDRDDKSSKRSKFNDPGWYNKSAILTHNVANLSFNNAVGSPQSISYTNVNGDLTNTDLKYTSPGIMAIQTGPAVGYSATEYSAINLAAKNFYSWIRHANSGHANYDSPDLMMYIMAMDQIYSMIAFMQRIYGVARVFSQTNRYVGDALLTAMRVSPSSIRQNLSDFRAYLNMYITKASAFVTPATMDIFKRHFWMYSGVFRDSDVAKSQFYMYVPAYVWTYNDVLGALSATPVCTALNGVTGLNDATLLTWSQVTVIADNMLNAIIASEDMNIMSGDILKAYPDSYWKLDLIPEDYSTVPVYSKEVLDQIHNTQFVGKWPAVVSDLDASSVTYSLGGFNMVQDKSPGYGVLMFMPKVMMGNHLAFDGVLDLDDEVINEDQVMVASRNMLHGSSSAMTNIPNTHVTMLDAIGSDVPFYATMYYMNANGVLSSYQMFTDAYTVNSNTAAIAYLSQFNKHPIRLYNWSGTGNARTPTCILGELDNYSIVDYNDLKEMHDVAMLSMLAVPYLGTKPEK